LNYIYFHFYEINFDFLKQEKRCLVFVYFFEPLLPTLSFFRGLASAAADLKASISASLLSFRVCGIGGGLLGALSQGGPMHSSALGIFLQGFILGN
jgi:hypothetical protein